MIKTIVLMIATTVLCGCAHKDLKAPCTNVAALSSESVPCHQREPVNATVIPSIFSQ